MLHPLSQFIPVNIEDIVHLANTSGGKSFLVDMNITIIRTAVGGVHIKED